jgi:hypothetical protein
MGNVFRQYNNWSEFTDYLENTKQNNPSDCSSRQTSSFRTEFTKTYSWDEAINLAKIGWQTQVPAVRMITEAVSIKIKPVIKDAFNVTFDVSGGETDVGRYVEGEPECMVESVIRETVSHNRTVTILINGCFSATTQNSSIIKRGQSICGLVESLELAQMSSEIWWEVSNSLNLTNITYLIKLKDTDEPLDVSKIMFVIGHPASLRRLVFGAWELESSDLRRLFGFYNGNYYGCVANGLTCDIVKPDIDLRTIDPYSLEIVDPVAWILNVLGKYGVIEDEENRRW